MSRTIRNVRNRQAALQRYRAERLLRKGFGELRSKVLAIVRSRLHAKGLTLDRADLEACYAQAWQGLYTVVLAGETIDSPEAWLVLVTFRRAVDELRSAARTCVGEREDVAALAAETVVEPEIAAGIDDRVRLRAVFEAIRLRLSERECEAASLCYLQGLSRAEAAMRMGISERRMQKLMEGSGGAATGVAGKVGELIASIQAGGWCEQQSSLMRAYAFGILDPDGERHSLAVAHTRQCPACRAHVASLRGLASVLPPLPFAFPLGGSAGAGARAVSGSSARAVRIAARSRWPLAGANVSLPIKLVVTGALLIGAGSAYLAARPSTSPAHRQAARAAVIATGGSPSASISHRHLHEQATGRPLRARQAVAKRRRPLRRATDGRQPSASEFLPERAHDGVPSVVVPTTPSSSSTGEFGIE